jgi:WXG100 family type VII secretion target
MSNDHGGGGGGEITVSFAALAQASGDIQNAVKTLNSELDALKQGIAPLLSTWTGEAQTAYYQKQSQWEQAAGDINQLLGEIKMAVDRSAEMMMAREKANMQKF